MLEFKRRKIAYRLLYSPWTLALLATVLIFMMKAAWNVHQKEVLSRESLERSIRELDKLASREKNLANSVSFLGTPKGIETEIRSKFRVVKEGEAVAVILDDSPSSTVSTTTPERSFFGKIFGIFGF